MELVQGLAEPHCGSPGKTLSLWTLAAVSGPCGQCNLLGLQTQTKPPRGPFLVRRLPKGRAGCRGHRHLPGVAWGLLPIWGTPRMTQAGSPHPTGGGNFPGASRMPGAWVGTPRCPPVLTTTLEARQNPGHLTWDTGDKRP